MPTGSWIYEQSNATGTGSGGGTPPTVINAPNITHATGTLYREPYGSIPNMGVQGTIDLPTTDPHYSLLTRIDVRAVDSNGNGKVITSVGGPWPSSGHVDYAGIIEPQPSADDHYDIEYVCYNPQGVPTPGPYKLPGGITLPGTSGSVLSVAGVEVGPHYVDRQLGQHTIITLTPTLADPSADTNVTYWLQFGDGKWVRQGVWLMTTAITSVTIGEQTWGTEGQPNAGPIWVPTSVKRRTWKVAAAAGNVESSDPPSTAATSSFDVAPVDVCRTDDCTDIHFVINPATNDEMTYVLRDPGIWYWLYFELDWTTPTKEHDENYWFSMVTVETGYTDNSGVWHSWPGQWGDTPETNQSLFLGRHHAGSGDVQGGDPVLGSVIKLVTHSDDADLWKWPPTTDTDGSPNPWRTVRFRVYAVSRLGTDVDGGEGAFTLQPGWEGGADHYDLTPAQQPWALDLSQSNPKTSFPPSPHTVLTGGAGSPVDVSITAPLANIAGQIALLPKGVDSAWIADGAVTARTTALNAINSATGALAANSVVDGLVTLPVAQLVYGSAIFTGDVYLSRGTGKPVVALENSAITLYGSGDATGQGIANGPWTRITNASTLLYGGDGGYTPAGTGSSVQLTGTGITLYQRNGDLTNPNFALTSTALSFRYPKTFGLDLSASGVVITHDNSGNTWGTPVTPAPSTINKVTNTLDATQIKLMFSRTPLPSPPNDLIPSLILQSNFLRLWSKDQNASYPYLSLQSDMLSLTFGNYQTIIRATSLQLLYSGASSVTLTSTNVVIANGGSSITLDNTGSTFTVGSATTSIYGGNIDTQNVTIHHDLYNSGTTELTDNVSLATAVGKTVTMGTSVSDPVLYINGKTYPTGGSIQFFISVRINNATAGLIPVYSF